MSVNNCQNQWFIKVKLSNGKTISGFKETILQDALMCNGEETLHQYYMAYNIDLNEDPAKKQ
eukprot:15367143-Ditylum_brightwellii.AAC.1